MPDRAQVAIIDDYQDVALTSADWASAESLIDVRCFTEHVDDEDQLVDQLAGFDIVVIMRERTPFPASLIRRLPKLRLLVTTGERNASVDVRAAADAGVLVCGTRSLSNPTAELTWALILGLSRHLPTEDAHVRAGRWQELLGEGLEGKTLGLVGLGRVGSRVARVARAFDMPVIAWSENLTAPRAAEVEAKLVSSDELFRTADIVSIHLRLSPRTEGLVGGKQLRAMKRSSYLINTSRAEIVDRDSLVRALSEGWIAGAALDVYEQEPLPQRHPILGVPNTVLTPHIGYVVRQNYELFFQDALEDITGFLAGEYVRVITPE